MSISNIRCADENGTAFAWTGNIGRFSFATKIYDKWYSCTKHVHTECWKLKCACKPTHYFLHFFSLQKMFILLTPLFCDFDWRIACNNAIEINRTFLLLFFSSARIHNKSLWFSCPFDHFHSIFFGDTTNSYEIIKINFHCRTSIGFSIFFLLLFENRRFFGNGFYFRLFRSKSIQGQLRILFRYGFQFIRSI